MFFKKKVNSEEYEILIKKITTLTNLVDEMRQKVELMTTNMNSLRGLVNRRMSGEKEDTTNDLNNSVILPDNGIIGKLR